MKADARCRSCHAPVRWVITEAKGKRMPLDPMPVADGNVWVIHWEGSTPIVGVALNRAGVPASVPFAYQAHWVSCPNSDEWRKRDRGTERSGGGGGTVTGIRARSSYGDVGAGGRAH